jgi:serine/threonine protein kinase
MGTATDAERTVVERCDPLLGTILDGRFRIDFQLAAGGFGAIYRATDVHADAQVALKVLLPQLAGDPRVVERFRREGKLLANLRDPHTITAYEIGEAPDGTLYIVMELLRGVSLYERFRAHGRLPWRRMLHIARGVCSSLAEAHALGIVHRDLKPANIHLEVREGDPEFAKVLDFGIAKIIQGNEHDRTELTQAGQMIGTVDYMSPEQMVGGEMTPQSDIYTLGILIYEMIGGRTPFAEAQTATAILAAVLTQVPAPLSAYVDVPRALDHVVRRCLEREPVNRFADVSELADALAAIAAVGAEDPSRWSGTSTSLPEVTTVPTAVATVVPTSGFEEDAALTTDATRIDVRVTNSSQPVLDARGPRGRPAPRRSAAPPPVPPRAPAPLSTPTQLPPPVSMRAIHARGSQHAIDERLAGGPMIDAAAWHRPQGPMPAANAPQGPAPYGYFQREADATPAGVSYELLAARKRAALMHRVIWWTVLFLVSTVVTLLATR